VSGVLSPGSSLKAEQNPFLVYDDPQPPIAAKRSPGARASSEGEIIDVIEENGHISYVIQELLETGADPFDQLPAVLTPSAPPRATPQPEAIEEWGSRVLGALPEMLPDAALDVLRRVPPRGTLSPAGDDTIAAIRDSLITLEHSYLAVQGPPGTGKTYTGSRVIADLVQNHGWKVGIVAQSHETVKNMLRAIAAAGLDPKLIAKKPKKGDTDEHPWVTLSTPANTAEFTAQQDGWVIGGTAWTFANAGTIPRQSLDLLVVDEAGQFSLASTVAASVSATRLLLLGDPQQLPQVSQGSHPEPVDESALGWLADGHDVLPAEYGYFLATTWRMHPALCAPVSELSYGGALTAHASDRRLEGVTPGLHVEPVTHVGNTTSSVEEARAVVEIVRSVVGLDWSDADGTRPLTAADVIVVAPYNAHGAVLREHLDAAGFDETPVGTVDLFQGQEAVVAVVSLAASSAADIPRGLDFLLMPNRLNVALSRAKWAAFLVHSPLLATGLPTSIAGLGLLSGFLRLTGQSQPAVEG
jgi:hypothetical protein